MTDWKKVLIQPELTIQNTIQIIDDNSMQIAIVVDKRGRLLGTVTDGDVRRGILRGVRLEESVAKIMNQNPTKVKSGNSNHEQLTLMKQKQIRHLPIVDHENRVVDIQLLDSVEKVNQKQNWVLIMAGGLGTRLRPLTDEHPKPLLKVGDRPILETIINYLSGYGFHKFYLSVNYKAEMIKEYFGDGGRFGVEIRYIEEKKRMGTAGALSLLSEIPTDPILVMNSDLLTTLNFEKLLLFHLKNRTIATMSVHQYDIQIPFGVVEVENNRLIEITEKPSQQFFINAGIYMLDPAILKFVPKDSFYDMTTLLKDLLKQSYSIAVFPIREYWLDIGRLDDLKRANQDYPEVFL